MQYHFSSQGKNAGMAITLVIAILLVFQSCCNAQLLAGAGTASIAPLLSKWIASYKRQDGAEISYQPIGSAGGRNALIERSVDFACSDARFTLVEAARTRDLVIVLPIAVRGIAIAYNLPGVTAGLHLTGKVLGDIFGGHVEYWDDPDIEMLNASTALPHDQILAYHSYSPSTTLPFAAHLFAANPSLNMKLDSGGMPQWPSTSLGAHGKADTQLARDIRMHEDTIAYMDLANARKCGLYCATIQNAAGKWIAPSLESVAVALDGATSSAAGTITVGNTQNPDAYPICGVTYAMVRNGMPGNVNVKKFLRFILTDGQKPEFTGACNCAPLPESLRNQALARIDGIW